MRVALAHVLATSAHPVMKAMLSNDAIYCLVKLSSGKYADIYHFKSQTELIMLNDLNFSLELASESKRLRSAKNSLHQEELTRTLSYTYARPVLIYCIRTFYGAHALLFYIEKAKKHLLRCRHARLLRLV
jgi:hypothetical protein